MEACGKVGEQGTRACNGVEKVEAHLRRVEKLEEMSIGRQRSC